MLLITDATPFAIEQSKRYLGDAILIAEETRINHTAIYPLHNRYFSNGDKPWVFLINTKNTIKLFYQDKDYIIEELQLVLFDDNVMHSWGMKNNDITIYYYRKKSDKPVVTGTYCIDNFF